MSRAAPLQARGLAVSFGGRTILDDVDVTLPVGRRVGLVGPNGIGKSTLLRALAGLIEPESGTIIRTPPEATVGFLHQELDDATESGDTVAEMLRRRTGVSDAEAELAASTEALAKGEPGAADWYAATFDRWMSLGAADFDSRVEEALADVGLDPACLGQHISSLSGGQAGRVGLAALLLSRYDVYLLDEPTNDLDLAGLDVLERWIAGLDASAVMVVSHDRRFLAHIVTDVLEIDEFSRTAQHFAGGWQAYLDERERARRHAWERFEQYDADRKGLLKRAQRQREWADQGRSAARRSGETDKFIRHHQINQTEKLAGKAAQTKQAMQRLETVEKPREPWQLKLSVDSPGRSGDVVAALDGAVVTRGHFQLGPVDLELGFRERVVLAGANGSGKSTLVDALLGRAALDAGTVRLGPSVVVGEITQARRQLDDAYSGVTGGAGRVDGGIGRVDGSGDVALGDRHSDRTPATLLRTFVDLTGSSISDTRTLLAKFGLVGDHVERPAPSLSPGERTRAALALLMANGANWLVLDEPTNHLDLPAIEQLEAALETFDGTVLLVSHDRALLERVATTRAITLADGRVVSDVSTVV